LIKSNPVLLHQIQEFAKVAQIKERQIQSRSKFGSRTGNAKQISRQGSALSTTKSNPQVTHVIEAFILAFWCHIAPGKKKLAEKWQEKSQ